jgi:hypothetical protein
MTTLSTYLSNYYGGLQGIQGIQGGGTLQGISGVQGTIGISNTTTNVGLATTSGFSYTFTTNDIGKFVGLTTGGGTISSNTYVSGDVITIFNNSNAEQTINFVSGINAYGIGITSKVLLVGIVSNQYMNILCVDSNKFIVY